MTTQAPAPSDETDPAARPRRGWLAALMPWLSAQPLMMMIVLPMVLGLSWQHVHLAKVGITTISVVRNLYQYSARNGPAYVVEYSYDLPPVSKYRSRKQTGSARVSKADWNCMFVGEPLSIKFDPREPERSEPLIELDGKIVHPWQDALALCFGVMLATLVPCVFGNPFISRRRRPVPVVLRTSTSDVGNAEDRGASPDGCET